MIVAVTNPRNGLVHHGGPVRAAGRKILVDDPDYEWLMIDANHIKVHPDAAGARGGNQIMGCTKGDPTPKYIWLWMRMVCQSESLLQKVPERMVKKLPI